MQNTTKKLTTLRYIDLFSGVGGFRYGIERAYQPKDDELQAVDDKHNANSDNLQRTTSACVYSNEWDKYANSVYRRHYGECDDRDIRTVKTDEIPDHDLLCAGFPCQAFSISGRRMGFEDTRGTLFYDIARILREHRPSYLILENVKGLTNHDGGLTFRVIIRELSQLGYDLQWQVINSKNYSPQNRERIYIVGHLRTIARPKVFPIIGERDIHLQEVTQGVSDAQRIYRTTGIAKTLKALGGGLGAKTGLYLVDGNKVRRLTPTECERLQGFPDGWTKYGHEGQEISDTQRYKMMGNAVTTNVITSIIQSLDRAIEIIKDER